MSQKSYLNFRIKRKNVSESDQIVLILNAKQNENSVFYFTRNYLF